MMLLGQMLGLAGVDMNTGLPRFTFGILDLYDGVELVALALGLFGIAEFLKSVNRLAPLHVGNLRLGLRDLLPSRADLRIGTPAMMRGSLVGALCAMVPGNRADHRLVRVVCVGEEDFAHARALRHRHDRGRGEPRRRRRIRRCRPTSFRR